MMDLNFDILNTRIKKNGISWLSSSSSIHPLDPTFLQTAQPDSERQQPGQSHRVPQRAEVELFTLFTFTQCTYKYTWKFTLEYTQKYTQKHIGVNLTECLKELRSNFLPFTHVENELEIKLGKYAKKNWDMHPESTLKIHPRKIH